MTAGGAPTAPLTVAVLLSLGRHPVSGRPRRASADAAALEAALRLPGAEVRAVHAGDPAAPGLRDYLGMGLPELTVLRVPPGADPLPALADHLEGLKPRLVLTGLRAEGDEDGGTLPYVLAHRLGYAVVAGAVGVTIDGTTARVVQALPRGRRRAIEAGLPLVAAVAPTALAGAVAFARARRGVIRTIDIDAPEDRDGLAACAVAPWRARPKPAKVAAGNALDRLRAATETRAGGGQLLVRPSPEAAAEAIFAALVERGAVKR